MVLSSAASRRAWPSGPWRFTLLIGALLALPGCAIGRRSDLSFPQPCVPDKDGVRICVDSGRLEDSLDVPLLLHWHHKGAPFDLIVRINDDQNEYESVTIDSVRVEYSFGPDAAFDEPQHLAFEPIAGLQCSEAAVSYPGLITSVRDGSVVLTGTLRNKNGASRPFHARRTFSVDTDAAAFPYFVWLQYGIT